jgi:hypothetical protein
MWNDVLHDIRQKIRYRQYPCPTSSVFDTQLSVFVFENIRIRICIRSYPYSNSNPNKNMKTNMVSVISVRIRSDYIPNEQYPCTVHADLYSLVRHAWTFTFCQAEGINVIQYCSYSSMII